MKTKEVVEELEKMNLRAEKLENNLIVTKSKQWYIASIDLERKFEISTNFSAFEEQLTEDEIEKLYFLLTKLAETDPEDREEEKKYYLRHKWLDSDRWNYLNFYITDDSCELSDKPSGKTCKTQFTQKEIDEIKERFNTNLEDFEQIPVEDYEER